MSAGLQDKIVDELRLCAGGKPPTARELRLAVDCTAAELATAVQSLRYAGKLEWKALELRPSMLTEQNNRGAPGTAREASSASSSGDATRDTVHAPTREEEPVAGASLPPAPSVGPDEDDGPEDEYPGNVNDQTTGGEGPAPLPAGPPAHSASAVAGFVPKSMLHKAGVHGAATRAASRPLPAPQHEPEIARQVREEVEEIRARRRRATSTGTVRQPLELKAFGVPDLTFAEGVQSMLVETPHDLMASINRKHAALWRRVILLGRARGERPAEALYAALEHGLEQLEQSEEPEQMRGAA